jgi:hypothetical protein
MHAGFGVTLRMKTLFSSRARNASWLEPTLIKLPEAPLMPKIGIVALGRKVVASKTAR